LIPETLAKTTLSLRLQGARVNVEADSMAKAVAAEVARHMHRLGISADSMQKSQ
jgi:riboflavin synthase alpha subunit